MPPKKRSREGHDLQRQDNNLNWTSWFIPSQINQKNYYTDNLKRDDQILAFRLQAEENRNRLTKAARDRDRALAQQGANESSMVVDGQPQPDEDELAESEMKQEIAGVPGSRTIIIHPGSHNLRIGLASDPLPRTVPMVIARKAEQSESEANGDEPRPKRRKVEGRADQVDVEEWFTEAYSAMTVDLKGRLRMKGVRFVPNTREQAQAYNRKSQPDVIPEHNDINKIEWTELPDTTATAPDYFVGQAALRLPDKSKPRYKLSWPLRYGTFNEKDYSDGTQLTRDITAIIEEALKSQLGLPRRSEWAQYSVVLVVPDLYERNYVTTWVEILLRDLGLNRICLTQESLAAAYGAGSWTCCIVDVGAYKTSICCVDEGMVIENSRIIMRYGSSDVTEAFIKMMLMSNLPYSDLNLRRRYDALLAEELKQRFCTLAYSDLAHGSRQFDFYLRAPNQDTRHYLFKCYDEPMLASMGYFRPGLFENSDKLAGRRSLIGRSYDIYDGAPNDPLSSAQAQLLSIVATTNAPAADQDIGEESRSTPQAVASTPSRPAFQLGNGLADGMGESGMIAASSPAGEIGTPQRAMSPVDGAQELMSAPMHPLLEMIKSADQRDRTLPCIPLDEAIALSVEHAARGDEKKMRDYFGGIIPIGGGSQTNGFRQFLEEELQTSAPKFSKEVLVSPPPREIDPQVLVWKGASIFGKLQGTNDTWISQLEWERLGSRVLTYKCLWSW